MPKELILLDDVEGLGIVGEVVKVTEGYARNYLLPQRLAQPFTENARKRLDVKRQQRQIEIASEMEKATLQAEKVSATTATISVKTSSGKLYGSVHEADIVKAAKEAGLQLDKKQILLGPPLRELGEFSVKVRLHPKVTAPLKVLIVAEE